MKIGMSDRLNIAEIPCKFRCDPMSGRGGAGERSEPPLTIFPLGPDILSLCSYFPNLLPLWNKFHKNNANISPSVGS